MNLRYVSHSIAAAASFAIITSAGAAAQGPVPSTAPTRPVETLIGTGPNGATMRCRDGSYPAPNAAPTACDSKGGLLVRFPVRRIPASAAARPARMAAPAAPALAIEAPATGEKYESRANVFIPAERPPAGATLLCVDGSFIVADTSRSRCATRGGVKLILPPKPRG